MKPHDESAPRTAVPADINTPDKIVFGLTGQQLIILAAAGGIGWVLYQLIGRHLPPTMLVVVAIPYAGVAAMIALFRRDGLGMDVWLRAALRLRRTPRLQAPAGTSPARAGLVATTGALPVPGPLRLPADAITPAGLVQVGDNAAAVVAAGTVNLGLRTGDEQTALLDGFAGWLNSLTAPAQIVVSTQRVDLGPAAAAVEEAAPLLPHPALEEAAVDYAGFLRELAETRDPLRRHVLLVVKADPRERGGAARRGEDTARSLTALGVAARMLDGPSYTAALAAAVDPYAPPVPGLRATPDRPDALNGSGQGRPGHCAGGGTDSPMPGTPGQPQTRVLLATPGTRRRGTQPANRAGAAPAWGGGCIVRAARRRRPFPLPPPIT